MCLSRCPSILKPSFFGSNIKLARLVLIIACQSMDKLIGLTNSQHGNGDAMLNKNNNKVT